MTSNAYTPAYSTISIQETQKLASVKASGACWAIYAVLVSYSRNGTFEVFPSWDTISRILNHAYSRKTIADALNFLEKHRIIKRKASKKRRSKTIKLITRSIQALCNGIIEKPKRVKKPSPTRNSGDSKRKSLKDTPKISKKLGLECRNLHQKKIKKENNKSILMNRENRVSNLQDWFESAFAYVLRPDLWSLPNPIPQDWNIETLLENKWVPPGTKDDIRKIANGSYAK